MKNETNININNKADESSEDKYNLNINRRNNIKIISAKSRTGWL